MLTKITSPVRRCDKNEMALNFDQCGRLVTLLSLRENSIEDKSLPTSHQSNAVFAGDDLSSFLNTYN
ncbi:MAG: hypothetical protein CMG82_05645 [Marinobacter sp.]|jgi:hypothetical protein|nr:hypothetical protein [Marinobacter sp.]|tara:strand:+ start:559 stop:759 length:201 start_codon:yes stop_codon:yes gene_type:complete